MGINIKMNGWKIVIYFYSVSTRYKLHVLLPHLNGGDYLVSTLVSASFSMRLSFPILDIADLGILWLLAALTCFTPISIKSMSPFLRYFFCFEFSRQNHLLFGITGSLSYFTNNFQHNIRAIHTKTIKVSRFLCIPFTLLSSTTRSVKEFEIYRNRKTNTWNGVRHS